MLPKLLFSKDVNRSISVIYSCHVFLSLHSLTLIHSGIYVAVLHVENKHRLFLWIALVLVIQTPHVFCEVEREYFNIIWMNLRLPSLNYSLHSTMGQARG